MRDPLRWLLAAALPLILALSASGAQDTASAGSAGQKREREARLRVADLQIPQGVELASPSAELDARAGQLRAKLEARFPSADARVLGARQARSSTKMLVGGLSFLIAGLLVWWLVFRLFKRP